MDYGSFASAELTIRQSDHLGLDVLLKAEPALATAIGEFDKTLLHEAAEVDAANAAEILIAAGASLESRTSWGHTPLEWAATMGATRVGTLLLRRGASGLNLWTAAGLGDLDTVRAAFQDGRPVAGSAQPRSLGSLGDPWGDKSAYHHGDVVSDAFHSAARNGHLEVAEFLLEAGADINARGFFGAPALHWAAHFGHRDMVVWLIDRGASVALRDPKFEATAGEWAAEGGHPNLAEHLAAFGRTGGEER